MNDFMIHFLICNIFISGMIGLLLVAKKIGRKYLTSRMQYNLWFLLFFLLIIPFLPLQTKSRFQNPPFLNVGNVIAKSMQIAPTNKSNWMQDFALSVSRKTPSALVLVLFELWMVGIFIMIVLMLKSIIHFNTLKKSSLPLQNDEIRNLYNKCLNEMNITSMIPVYSTAFLKSPMIAGFFTPCIYLPLHLISDYQITDLRYMLLHELQHYKHQDALANYLMHLTGVFYWFNPFVWYALREMRIDREVACDSSVLAMLEENSYEDYGNTLINYAQKISITPFPFAAGLSGSMKQMKRRILNISFYQKETKLQKRKGICSFFLIACILSSFAPMLSAKAKTENTYQPKYKSNTISSIDLSFYFGDYKGCFVLYDSSKDSFRIYNESAAKKRISPNSTYKIYSALLGLENGFISPAETQLKWNGEINPFAEWNTDQNLSTALGNSVNWYFELLDEKAGLQSLEDFYAGIHYGNYDLSSGVSEFWKESSLKISPLEQVELLKKLNENELQFKESNVQAVKNALLLSSNPNGSLYGKTGTGAINGQNVNGWFVGYAQTPDTTYYFATNIQNDSNASGQIASKITLKLLHDLAGLNF